MAAFAAVLDRRATAEEARAADTADTMRAANGRIPPTEAWSEAPLSVRFGFAPQYEDAPAKIRTGDGVAWIEGRLTNDPEATECALRGVVAGDVGACAALRGPFSVWAWNSTTKTLRVATDPVGSRPVYWAAVPGEVVVASEIREVLRHRTVTARIDEVSLLAHLAGVAMPAADTLYEGVSFLAPGHVLEADDTGRVDVRKWWQWPVDLDLVTSVEEWAGRIRMHALTAVDRAVPAGRLGVMLSGGLDSSMLAGMASTLRGADAVTALAVRIPGGPGDETRFQDAVVNHTGVSEISVGLQEGFDYWATLKREVARRGLPVPWLQPEMDALLDAGVAAGLRHVLRGVGGDELFAPGTTTVFDALASRAPQEAWRLLGPAPLRSRVRWAARDVLSIADRASGTYARRRRVLRALPDWLVAPPRLVRTMAERAAVAPSGLGFSAANQRSLWDRFSTHRAAQAAEWRDAAETRAGVALVDPLLDVDLIVAMAAVPEPRRWVHGDPRRLQRGVAHPFVPGLVDRRADKADLAPALAAHLDHPDVVEVLRDLELARLGLVDAPAIDELYRQVIGRFGTNAQRSGADPTTVALILGAEALVRSVAS